MTNYEIALAEILSVFKLIGKVDDSGNEPSEFLEENSRKSKEYHAIFHGKLLYQNRVLLLETLKMYINGDPNKKIADLNLENLKNILQNTILISDDALRYYVQILWLHFQEKIMTTVTVNSNWLKFFDFFYSIVDDLELLDLTERNPKKITETEFKDRLKQQIAELENFPNELD